MVKVLSHQKSDYFGSFWVVEITLLVLAVSFDVLVVPF
jgi:hypothetical protein